jgi:hypothetical protein
LTSVTGGNIGINSLTTYSLALIVGGNLDDDSRSLITLSPANAKVSDLGLVAQIPIDVGQSIQNGYYLSMVSEIPRRQCFRRTSPTDPMFSNQTCQPEVR